MHPVLIQLGPVTLYSYGAALVAAFSLVVWLAGRAVRKMPAKSRPLSPEQAVDFTCYALLGGILGGRIVYGVLTWPAFLEHPLEFFAIWHGGLVWYGGFLGGALAGVFYTRANRLPALRVMDHFIPYVALGHAIGRIGCFLNGCCYGRPSDAWCAVEFPGHGVSVLPTQLFEAAGLFILFIALRRLQRPRVLARPGWLLGLYLCGYGLLRFVIEAFRGDQVPFLAGLTLQQVISLGLFVLGLALCRARTHS
jgi:phosphatidylglycerol:prolipoprotein diacylglycerol transferase